MTSRKLVKKIVGYSVLSTCLFVFSMYVFYTAQRYADYVRDPNLRCSQPEEDMAELLNLTYEIHEILNSLKIDHWLMYGSVFGALRIQGPLPWDYDVDIGIRGEQFLQMRKSDFLRSFLNAGIKCIDHLDRNGLVGLSKPGRKLGVDVFTFYDYDGIMKRPGWAAWLLFVNYELHHTFPSRLVKSPMPQKKFGFFHISVPRGGNEVLKYLYRFDWWKEVKPIGCQVGFSATSAGIYQ